ncbi:MAG: fimbria/pilus outer membrane usher protein [Arsenophonus sp.]
MKKKLTLSRIALFLTLFASNSLAESITIFDADILQARGIPDSVSRYLEKKAQFLPGHNHISLMVNGIQRGIISVNFDNKGSLCANSHFLHAAGIIIPKSEDLAIIENYVCPSLPKGIDIKLYPGRNSVELLAPTQWIADSASEIAYVKGGSAALLNYNLQISGNHTENHRSHSFYAHAESGFNFNNWIVRSYDSYSGQSDNNMEFNHRNAWVQRTFPYFKSTIQAGQLTLNSLLFSIPSFNGFQLMPESVLLKANNGVRVTGIAPSAARIDIRQGGTLIYSTIVPSGTFSIDSLPVNNYLQELEVTIIENNGGQKSFIVPSTSFNSNFMTEEKGWTFAAGLPRNVGNIVRNLKTQGFVTATATFPVKTLHANITTGLMATQYYTSAGLNAKTNLSKGTSSYLRLIASRDKRIGVHGTITQAGHSMALGDSISATFTTAFYTLGFRYLTDKFKHNASLDMMHKRLYSASLGWNNDMLGHFSLGLSRIERFNNTAENYPTLSWGRNIGPANLSLSVSHHNGKDDDNMHYLHLSLPMGKTYANFSLTKEGRYIRSSSSINRQLSDTIGYSIGTSTTNNQQHIFNSSLNLQSHNARFYGNYSYNAHNNHFWSMSMNGSVVHDGRGLLFSPHNVHDTFGIVRVNGLNNAKIQTSAGIVWTNRSGSAIVPLVTPYSRSRVELITQGLPRNLEVSNARSITKSARGSVSRISLKVERNQKILLQVSDHNGKSFKQGMAVLDKQGRYLNIIGADSDVYLDARHVRNGLLIEDDNGNICTLSLTINSKPPKDDEPYEIVPAVCR